jgi:hypothetical protein
MKRICRICTIFQVDRLGTGSVGAGAFSQETIMAVDVRTTPLPNSVDFAAFGTRTAFTN